jgi:hypothetical protein
MPEAVTNTNIKGRTPITIQHRVTSEDATAFKNQTLRTNFRSVFGLFLDLSNISIPRLDISMLNATLALTYYTPYIINLILLECSACTTTVIPRISRTLFDVTNYFAGNVPITSFYYEPSYPLSNQLGPLKLSFRDDNLVILDGIFSTKPLVYSNLSHIAYYSSNLSSTRTRIWQHM